MDYPCPDLLFEKRRNVRLALAFEQGLLAQKVAKNLNRLVGLPELPTSLALKEPEQRK
jgi:hypothetical protein